MHWLKILQGVNMSVHALSNLLMSLAKGDIMEGSFEPIVIFATVFKTK